MKRNLQVYIYYTFLSGNPGRARGINKSHWRWIYIRHGGLSEEGDFFGMGIALKSTESKNEK
ncbi:MAG: hypothetical protein QG657_5850, partial [Acidobacteriota bacterium]|nr:hypothetical protein [Acidobacteriota bacterium]